MLTFIIHLFIILLLQYTLVVHTCINLKPKMIFQKFHSISHTLLLYDL